MSKTLWTILALLSLISLIACQTNQVNPCAATKYSVKDPSRTGCIPCRLCPNGLKENKTSSSCKKFYPDPVGNQGYAHCLNFNYSRPSCPFWQVLNGKTDCSDNFSIYSKCNVVCNPGYSVVNNAEVQCLENLDWNIAEKPWCKRTVVPGQPVITTTSVRSQIRPDTDVTLTCKNTTVLSGAASYHWFFNNEKLENDKSSKTYTIMAVKKGAEGVYRCSVEDEIGKSQTSPDFLLEVESNQGEFNNGLLAVIIIMVMSLLFILLFLTLRFRSKLRKCLSAILNRNAKPPQTIALSKCEETFLNGEEVLLMHKVNDSDVKIDEVTVIADHLNTASLPIEQSALLTETDVKQGSAADHFHELSPQESTLNFTGNQTSMLSPYSPQSGFTMENELQTSHCSSQHHSSTPSYLYEVANNDQKVFVKLLKTKRIVDQIVICLDQKPDVNRNHPTFKDFGRFLHLTDDKIEHIEYYCSQHKSSPTLELLQIMKSEGKGLNLLTEFLKSYHCYELIKFIQKEINGP